MRNIVTALVALSIALFVAGCTTGKAPAVITEISDEHVKVISSGTTDGFINTELASPAEMLAEAQRGCGKYGRKAEPISQGRFVRGRELTLMHLYSCVSAN